MTQQAPAQPCTPGVRPGPGPVLEGVNLPAGHSAVTGLQWGDEGKGQIVDMLAARFDYVVRYNGGNNAGHSVQIGDQKFALHLLPSGILYPQAVNVVGNGVVIDPAGILGEIKGLRERGVVVGDNLRISSRAHVVFPYHKLQDQLWDQAVSQTSGQDQQIGTTGRGIGPCYADKALRSTAIRMGELTDPALLRERLEHVVRVKNLILRALAESCGHTYEPFNAAALAQQYADYGQQLAPHIVDSTQLLARAIDSGKQLLFEGANAALLDVDHGTYPFVTSSNCSSLGVYAGAGVPGGTLTNVIGVVKVYTSRVGGGPHPTELQNATGDLIRKVGNEFGTTTGRPRRVGWLDLAAVRYAARLNGATALVCTGMSVLAGLPELQVCTGYRLRGQPLEGYPVDGRLLAQAEPVYERMEGFPGPIDACKRFDELPPAARAYVERIEQFAGVPVKMVCVGRRRDQILFR